MSNANQPKDPKNSQLFSKEFVDNLKHRHELEIAEHERREQKLTIQMEELKANLSSQVLALSDQNAELKDVISLNERTIQKREKEKETNEILVRKIEELEDEKKKKDKRINEIMEINDSIKAEFNKKRLELEKQIAEVKRDSGELLIRVQLYEDKMKRMEEAKALEMSSQRSRFLNELKKTKESARGLVEE